MISTLLLRVSVLLALIGMAGGIAMGIAQNFMLAPAHAHLNLVGFVSLFLAGLYYHVMPHVADSVLAKIHATIAIVGAILFPIGIAIVLTKGPAYEVYPISGALIAFAGMLLFTYIIFRNGLRRAA